MEAEFLSLGLDIIGIGVFNFDFGSITSESPVIKVRPHTFSSPFSLIGDRSYVLPLSRLCMGS